jgi:Zn-dependent protease
LLDFNFAQIFIAFTVLLFSLTVHEMAHAWTADVLGDPTARIQGRVSFNPIVHADPIGTIVFPLIAMVSGFPLLGWAKPVPVDVRRLRNQHRDFVVVAAAGPASNLVLAVVASSLLVLMPVTPVTLGEPNASAPIAAMLSQAVRLNVLLAVFNMLPIPPLDGGNVVSGLLPRPMARQFDLLRPYGFLVLYALMFTGNLDMLLWPPYNVVVSLLPTR